MLQPGTHGGTPLSALVITLLIAVAVLALRNRRPRRLRLEAMWIRPLIFLVLVGLTLAAGATPTDAASLVILLFALAAGVAAGWTRGRLMRIEVHPETHDITSRASVAGMMFILAVLAVRMFIRNASPGASVGGLPAATVVDALIFFAAAMMITQSLEMFLRARRMLGEAKAAALRPGDRPIVS